MIDCSTSTALEHTWNLLAIEGHCRNADRQNRGNGADDQDKAYLSIGDNHWEWGLNDLRKQSGKQYNWEQANYNSSDEWGNDYGCGLVVEDCVVLCLGQADRAQHSLLPAQVPNLLTKRNCHHEESESQNH